MADRERDRHWSLYALIAGIGAYIVSPIIVDFAKARINPTSPAAKVIVAIYPSFVSDRIIPPSPNPSPGPVTPEMPSAGTRLAVTPASSPLQAFAGSPVFRDRIRFDITIHLQASQDGLPIFVTRRGGYLAGWSATVPEGGANCAVYWTHISNLPVAVGEWTSKTSTYAVSATAPVPISMTFNCDKQIEKGQSVEITAQIGVVQGDGARTVNIASGPLRLLATP